MANISSQGEGMYEDLEEMWAQSTHDIGAIDPVTENWKIQTLPLARIKKIMKSEEFILQELEKERLQKAAEEGQAMDPDKPHIKFMISGEAPVLMSKACELLIKDLSFRAWRHTERNRRRTLQRQDLHAAVGESEVYDFLIDIVPRVTTPKASVPNPSEAAAAAAAAAMTPQMPTGLPMGGIPTGIPQTMTTAPPVPQPMTTMVDTTMMHQVQQPPQPAPHHQQHQHQQQPQQQQHHQAQIQQQHQQQQPPPAQQQQTLVHQYTTDQQQQVAGAPQAPAPQQQHPPQPQYTYLTVPQVATAADMSATTGIPQPQQTQWLTQPVANTGVGPPPS